MAGGKKKETPPNAYQKQIREWGVPELENHLLERERKLHIDAQGDGDRRPEIFRTLVREWCPGSQDRLDSNGLPTCVTDEDRKRILANKQHIFNISTCMLSRADALGALEHESVDINGDPMSLERRIKKFKAIYKQIADKFLNNAIEYSCFNQPLSENVEIDTDIERDASPYQKLLLHLLNQAQRRGFRRYRDQCCEEIESGGHMTRAWKTVKEIKEFVYDEAQKEENPEMWLNLTQRGNMANDTIRHLANCNDIQFPEIDKDRHVWSFSNGLLDSRISDENRDADGHRCFKFYPYDSPEFQDLDPSVVSCKYFDQHFDPNEGIKDWYDIQTPYMQSVLSYQKFDEDVCRWTYVFMGRLCFDVNELDGWQIIPFLKGIARSGKSTLINSVAKKFYECEDVPVLSNNIERKFGLSSIRRGFLFVSPEIKGDLALEQAEFQSLVSGEQVSVARKNESALSFQWKTPGILGGNEVPNWKDNSGSILRRLATWNFGRQISDAETDPHLDEKLDAELPAILCKCLRAYLEYAHKYSDRDIWNVLPKYFKQIQNQIATVTNSLHHFLCSAKIRFDADVCVPQTIFVAQFNQHCRENNLGIFKFHPDFYAGPFSSRNLEVRVESRLYNGTAYSAQPFVFGLDFKNDEN